MTEVRPRGKQSALSENSDAAHEWLSNIPNIDEIYQCKSYDELSKIVNDWLNGDSESYEDEGTSYGASSASTEDKASSGYKSLDAAFSDLMDS